MSFSASKSKPVKWVPRRNKKNVPSFGLPAYPIILGSEPVDPRKAVRAVRRMMSEVLAAYVANLSNFKELTKGPNVTTKNIVSPMTWPALVEKDEESEEEESKNKYQYI